MFLTSQTHVEGREVKRLGAVTGEYMIGEDIYKGMLSEMDRYDEIKTPAYEEELEKAKKQS